MGEPFEGSAGRDFPRGVWVNAAGLLQLAAARGIDLNHVAGVASNVDGITSRRPRTALERKLGIDVRETASGRETRGHRRPAWGHAELGQAAQGLGAIPWAAALYSFAGSREGYWLLWDALSREATRLAHRDWWPPRVTIENGEPRFYRERLAQLVLDDEAHKALFLAAPGALHACYMSVTQEIWDRQLQDPYRSLQGAFERWIGIARATIGRRIRRED